MNFSIFRMKTLNAVVDEDVFLPINTNEMGDPAVSARSLIPPGVYKDIDELIAVINSLPCVTGHLSLLREPGGYITIHRICNSQCCSTHQLFFAQKLIKMLGFENDEHVIIRLKEKEKFGGRRPADLSHGLPNMAMIYTDLLEPIVAGDVHARLLRTVSLDTHQYTYGTTRVKHFSPPMHLPLLYNSFQTIELDIRDQHGQFLPFDCGTLTAVLHFRREE